MHRFAVVLGLKLSTFLCRIRKYQGSNQLDLGFNAYSSLLLNDVQTGHSIFGHTDAPTVSRGTDTFVADLGADVDVMVDNVNARNVAGDLC